RRPPRARPLESESGRPIPRNPNGRRSPGVRPARRSAANQPMSRRSNRSHPPAALEAPMGWRWTPTASSILLVIWGMVVFYSYFGAQPMDPGSLLDSLGRALTASTLFHSYTLKWAGSLLLALWILGVATGWGLRFLVLLDVSKGVWPLEALTY